ncbi:TonB-dependent receptor [Paraglaciecola aquimarina]|uniref:TonB-dependent receptor n=1 Tax=Paraglaciecola aquimarina TaxID=1235557 RepID=A0ABU3SX04_9ALTE|nr:TonB-dependent receptor [Paraglaciecola aquimarina]MDU0354554.1 TonB-dependent receptor [Paraglaciecola aquimarina]
MKETKSSLKLKNLLLGAASAAALMGSIHSVHAQEANANSTEDETEVIEVSGFRESLTSAMNIKRAAKNIVDAIKAEDIGKSSDQNIAEALQRVTGISIGRSDGEGTSITARGIGGDLNNVTLNGVPLTSSGDNQSVNFSEFSADILQAIEVQKTPSASTDEGSLGATIKLVGFKPLSAKKDRRVFEVQSRYNSFADTDSFSLSDLGDDGKLQFSFSEKFFDEKVGLSFVGSKETQATRLDRINIARWVPSTPINGVTYLGDTEPTAQDGTIVGYVPQNVQYHHQQVQRDRDTYQLALQFKLWEGSDIQFTYTKTNQEIFRDNQFMSINGDRSAVDASQTILDPETGNIVTNIDTAFSRDSVIPFVDNPLPNGNVYTRAGTWRQHRDVTNDIQETEVFGIDLKQEVGDFIISLTGGTSETDQYDDFNLRSFWRPRITNGTGLGLDRYSNNFAGYTCDNPEGDLLCRNVATEGYFDDGTNFEFQTFTDSRRFSNDKATNLYFDVEWDKEIGFITSLETGFKYSDRDKERDNIYIGCNRGCIEGVLNEFTLADFTTEQTPDDWGVELGLDRDHLTDGWSTIDIFAVRDFVRELEVDGKIEASFSPDNAQKISQEATAAYIQANFSLMDDALFGDFGLRYAKTTVTANGTSYLDYDANQSFQSTGIDENLSLFGFEQENGVPLATNTATEEEARAALIAKYGPLVSQQSENGETIRFAIEEEHSYNNLLPSLNLNYILNDDMVLRFAASQSMARPEFNKLFPEFNVRENIFGSTSNGSIGSAHLNPYKSTNFDLGFEWYFAEGSLFSAALFTKTFSDFTSRRFFNSYWKDVRGDYFDLSMIDPNDSTSRAFRLSEDQITADAPTASNILLPYSAGDNQAGCMINRELDLVDPDNSNYCDVVTMNQTVNGTGGYVRGLELSLQHNFVNLPGAWSGLGFVANYTYADSRTDEERITDPDGKLIDYVPEAPLAGTSEHTFNTTVFWEKDGKLVRLAYNYRTDYLNSLVVNDFGSHWVEGYGSLDLSANWKINNMFNVTFQAVNLTDTVIRRYDTRRPEVDGSGNIVGGESSTLGSQPTGRTIQLQNTGTIYRVGLRVTF